VVDISQGATLTNPEWDVFSVIQVIDENQYTIASIYPGEEKTFTPKDVALGSHLFLNMRTGVRSLDEKGYKEAHAHQDAVMIKSHSSIPYQPKGFETTSLDTMRKALKARMAEADKPEYYFGTSDEVEETQFLIASAVGIFGLPIKDAAYLNTIQPAGDARKGAPSKITLPAPPLNYEKGGFFSVTTYDEEGWIAKENFALNNTTATPNADGSYTFHFNAPELQNNIDVVENWSILIRLYAPSSVDEIMSYMKNAEQNIKIETL
ncbi:lytic murein transglycosylase, partial [Oleiphilus sp. HI0073]